jgi:hypothetical protein
VKRGISRVGFTGVLMTLFAAVLSAQQIPAGTWTGTALSLRGRNNQQARPASIEVKKTADPHWRWRPGGGDLLSTTFAVANARWTVGDLQFDGRVLSYWAMREESKITCKLELQPEKNYLGECIGESTRLRVNLSPPAEDSAQQPPKQP